MTVYRDRAGGLDAAAARTPTRTRDNLNDGLVRARPGPASGGGPARSSQAEAQALAMRCEVTFPSVVTVFLKPSASGSKFRRLKKPAAY